MKETNIKRKTYELDIIGPQGQTDWFRGTRRECFEYASLTYAAGASRGLVFRPAQEART